MSNSLQLKPIGYFHCDKKHPYQAARQGEVDTSREVGYIELEQGNNFDQGLIGLNEFSHIWLIYQFHQNQNWKPMVMPPRGSASKVGVFASRSPYRPNPLGMTCVKLSHINGRKVYVTGFDVLDGTPVFDIKPYLAYSDSYPEANLGWIKDEKYRLQFSEQAHRQIQFLHAHGEKNIQGFIQNQLTYDPLNGDKKRVEQITPTEAVLCYRTWRIDFHFQEFQITINQIRSGYSLEDLVLNEDPYQDKDLHRIYLNQKF